MGFLLLGGGVIVFCHCCFGLVSLIHLDFYTNLVIHTERTLLSEGFQTNAAADINSVGTSATELHIHHVFRLFIS